MQLQASYSETFKKHAKNIHILVDIYLVSDYHSFSVEQILNLLQIHIVFKCYYSYKWWGMMLNSNSP